MNKSIFVILIAIIATMTSTLIPLIMRGREVSPAFRRMLWISFVGGVVVLIIAIAFMLIS